MKINRDNYEVYFMDYLDGNLKPDQTRELQAFLLINNDLQEILEEMKEPLKLKVQDSPVYKNKELLKKDQIHACTDYYAIAIAEDTLEETDKQLLKHHPQIQQIQSDAHIYRKLKLNPDTNICFPKKKKLYHHSISNIYKYTAIAASFLIISTISLWLYRSSVSSGTEFCMNIPSPIVIEAIAIPDNQTGPIVKEITNPERQYKKKGTTVIPAENRDMIPPARIIALPVNKIMLLTQKEEPSVRLHITLPPSPEIILTNAASEWKSSENKFFSENILSGMLQAGKNIAEKIKTNF